MIRLLKVSGSSLLPDYLDGDFVVTLRRILFSSRRPYRNGQVVVFKHQQYGSMIKRVVAVSDDGSRLTVTGTHPDSIDSRHFGPVHINDVIGRVIWHISPVKKSKNSTSKFILLAFLLLLVSSIYAEGPAAKYANVFKPLDGKWKGKFYVYSHKNGQTSRQAQPQSFTLQTIRQLPLKEESVIDVEQVYTSESPFLQRVTITDTYTGPTGTRRKVVSRGVNKVQEGKLICIVDKPAEQVVHQGSTEDKHTIIWQRHILNPLKIELFKETVSKDSYTIIGWGYYGNDNPRLAPRTWFYAVYQRQPQ